MHWRGGMQALALDGMAQVLYPEYNVIDAARPLLSLHRCLCSRKGVLAKLVPGPLGRACFQLLVPLMQRSKRRTDSALQNRLRRRARRVGKQAAIQK